MPYISVHVDVEDVLDDLSDEDLRRELVRRAQRKGSQSNHSADYAIPNKVARYTLEEASDILRKQGRYDLAFKLEEIREDFVGIA
jgi:hypothetical protein